MVPNAETELENKAMEFYKASGDYNPNEDQADWFVHKMKKIIYYAMLYRTPEELIYERVDADKPNLGMLNAQIDKPTMDELLVARNYLSESECAKLDNTITNYLMMAEDQLNSDKTLLIEDWFSRLQGLLQMNGYAVLLTKSKVTYDKMKARVQEEFEKYLQS